MNSQKDHMRNLYEMICKWAAEKPESVAVVGGGGACSFSELRNRVDDLAG